MITLPYPPKELNPNNRSCWQKKHRKAKTYKNDCWVSLLPFRAALKGKTRFSIVFCPPSANESHTPDKDNIVAAFKAGQDMLAKVTGVNDTHFDIQWDMGQPKPPYGAVEVEPL